MDTGVSHCINIIRSKPYFHFATASFDLTTPSHKRHSFENESGINDGHEQ